MANPLTDEEIKWIVDAKENSGWSYEIISDLFGKKFHKSKTPNAMKKAYHRHKMTVKMSAKKPSSPAPKKQSKKAEDTSVYNKVLVISDLHIPYHHPDAFAFLKALNSKHKFDKIICIGDEVDYHAISFHDSDPNLPSAGDELALSKRYLKDLYKIFPKVDVIESNHGSLVYRKAMASGLPREFFKTYNDILDVPSGWKWQFDIKINTPLGMVYFCHGKAGIAGRLASQYGMSCVQGHYHEKAQIHYIGTPEKLMFDMHIGCLADDKSLALGYNKINPKRPIVSVGIIVDGIPQIVPMVLNKGGRWNGKV